jgi:sugar lactone lactonase YvrE
VSRPAKSAAQYFIRAFSLLTLLLFANVAYGQNTISTVAGSAPPSNVSPTAAPIEGPVAITRDSSGNLYVVNDNGVIYKVTQGTTAPSSMAIFAGNNTAGLSPNGTLATATLLYEPIGAAVDASGNFYFSDQNNCVVREIVAASGVMNTVAGTAHVCNYSGDGGQATSAELSFPQEVALDSSGNLYIADIGNSIVRRVNLTTGIITTYAGTPGAAGFPTNNVLATSTPLSGPIALAVDTGGNLFIADQNDDVVCRVDATSKDITIVAGTGNLGYSGDGGPATSATLRVPDGVAVDAAGNIYISDSQNAVIREVFSPTNPNTPNQINTIVGNTTFGFSGDGGPALSAELTNPAGLFVDSATGNLWIADFWANRIRLYTASSKTITTVVGSGSVGDGNAATIASLYDPRAPALDSLGNLYFVDAENNRIREVDTSGNISTVVGTGIPCAQPTLPCGDGGPATMASIFMPRTVTIEVNGDLLVSDDGDGRIREVSGGNINTIVGSGNTCGSGQGQVPLPCGDGGPALAASLNDARGAVRDAAGNLYFVDAQDNRVREVAIATGTITTIAGGGVNDTAPTGCSNGTYTGDGGPAVNATLDCPLGLDIDSSGNLYVADTDNNVIRKIDTGTPRMITTIAGTGTAGYSGNGGLATSANLNSPDRVSVNGAGNFFISDSGNNVIRRVDGTSKVITAFAGNGDFAFAGDGGAALSASFATPVGVVVTPQGNMYVGDVFNNRIRKVLLNPNIALSSTTAAFANQPINLSATLPVTVTNSGDAPLAISDIAITAGAFSLAASANPCPAAPATLAIGAQCVIEIAFMPTEFIAYTGTMTISDNAPAAGSAQLVTLSGMGAAALTVTVSGSGSGTVASAPAGISCPTTCAATFVGNSAVVLTATASTGSTFTGFGTNCTPASPQTSPPSCTISTATSGVTVTATFTATATGTILISPTSLTFGSQAVGTTSAAQTVTVSNQGGTTVTFANIAMSGDFAGATLSQCPSIGVEAEPCVFSIKFKPTAAGTRTGTITFTDNATGSPQTVTLTGTGTGGTATVTVTPSSLTFGAQAVSTTSAALSVTVLNPSTATVNFAGFTTSGPDAEDFTVPLPNASAGCSATGTLAAGASCTISVLFTPQAAGTRTATLNIADNATGSPQTVALSGTGVTSSVIITVAPGGSNTATTVSGGTAYYGLLITGAPGVTGTVQLGCVPSSVLITCKVIPGSVTLNGSSVEVAFAIQTFCQGATTGTGFAPPAGGLGGGLGMLLVSLGLGGAVWTFRGNRRVALTFATLLLVALGSAACNSLPSGPNGATPAGTYSLSLTTTLNGQTQTLPSFLTLVVK